MGGGRGCFIKDILAKKEARLEERSCHCNLVSMFLGDFYY